jgi:hypothetical protein
MCCSRCGATADAADLVRDDVVQRGGGTEHRCTYPSAVIAGRGDWARPRQRVGHPANPAPDLATRAARARTGPNGVKKGDAEPKSGSSLAAFGGGCPGSRKTLVWCT